MHTNYYFRISIGQQLKLLSRPAFLWIGLYAFCIIGKLNMDAFLFAGSFLFVLDTLPVIILHIQYWLKNRNAIFYIDFQKRKIIYEFKNSEISGYFEDIISFSSYTGFAPKYGFQSMEDYKYCKIELRNKEIIYLTILMIPDVQRTLETTLKIKPELHRKYMCLIK